MVTERRGGIAAFALRRPLVLIGIGVLLFSVGPVMVAGSDASGPVLSFWRLWIGSLLMGAISTVQIRRSGRRPDRVGWTWAARCGVAFGLHQLFFMSAIKRTSVVDVTLMQLLQPVIVGVLAAVLFGERPGRQFRVWSAVSMAGAGVVVLAGAAGPSGDSLGVVLAMLNVVFFAFYFVWSKQARDHIDTAPFLFGVVLAAAVVVSAYAGAVGEPVGAISKHDLLIAGAIAVIPGAIGHFVTTWPLRQVAANVPPLMQLAIPFLAGALAWLLLDQRISWLHLIGGLLSLGGVAGALRSAGGRRLVVPGPDATVVPGD